jgi:hypothetical protein
MFMNYKYVIGLTTAEGVPGFLRIAPVREILNFSAVTDFMEASRFWTRSSAMRVLEKNKDQIAALGVTDLPTYKYGVKVLNGGETKGFDAGDFRDVTNGAPFEVSDQIKSDPYSHETLAAMQEDGIDPDTADPDDGAGDEDPDPMEGGDDPSED